MIRIVGCGAMFCLALALTISSMRNGQPVWAFAAALPAGWFGGRFHKLLSERATP